MGSYEISGYKTACQSRDDYFRLDHFLDFGPSSVVMDNSKCAVHMIGNNAFSVVAVCMASFRLKYSQLPVSSCFFDLFVSPFPATAPK
jgi:hypothetical protein